MESWVWCKSLEVGECQSWIQGMKGMPYNQLKLKENLHQDEANK